MGNNIRLTWPTEKIGDISTTTSGGTPNRSVKEYWVGDIPWLKSGELNDTVITSCEEFITEQGLHNSSAKIFKKGSLLLALYGATAGKLGFLDFDSATNQAICCITPDEKLLDRFFLFYYLLGKRTQIIKDSFGGAQPNISQNYIRDFPIPLPPLPEQRRIVAKLDSLFGRIDKAIALVEENIKNARNLMASVLDDVYSELIEKYSVIEFPEVFTRITDGSHFSPKTVEIGKAYVTVRDIDNDGNINLHTCKKITENDYSQLQKSGCKPNQNDLLFSKDGTVGKVALVRDEQEFVVLSSLAILSPDLKKLNPDYVYFFLKSPKIQSEAIGLKTGAAIKRIVLKTIKTFKIPVPAIQVQTKVVNQLVGFQEKHYQIVKNQETRLSELKILKSSLLDAAFKGDL